MTLPITTVPNRMMINCLDPTIYGLEYEVLLRESIEKNCYAAVKLLLDFNEKYESVSQNSDFYSSYIANADKYKRVSKGLLIAAQRGNHQFIKLFLGRNYMIDDPHGLECQCNLCTNDRLGQSRRRIETLKAITNPVYIALTSEDPFLTTFKLCKLCFRYANQEDSFENIYHELANVCQQFCFQLLDTINGDEEVRCIMSHGNSINTEGEWDLAFVKEAIKYEQKEVRSDGSRYSRINQVKLFKDCLLQILLGPFLNTLTHIFV